MKSWKSLLVVAALLGPASARPQTATPAQAMALEQQGKLAEAAEAWRAVTGHNPQDAAAFASLGVVLARETQYKEAAAAYRKAIALNSRLRFLPCGLRCSRTPPASRRAPCLDSAAMAPSVLRMP